MIANPSLRIETSEPAMEKSFGNRTNFSSPWFTISVVAMLESFSGDIKNRLAEE
jgi:hypothetical protein